MFVEELPIRWRNVVRKRKAEALALAFRHRENYSATTKRISSLFQFYYGNKIELIIFIYRKTNKVDQ